MKIALSFNQKFLCAEAEPLGAVHANRDAIGAWETWSVESRGPDLIALKSVHGKYLCAEGEGGGVVVANRDQAGAWETFGVIGELTDGAALSLICVDGRHFLGVGADADHTLNAKNLTSTIFRVAVVEADAPAPSPSPSGPLSRLRMDGLYFVNEQSRRIYLRGASLFVAYWKWLEFGPGAVAPAADELHRNRCNAVRVFCMSYNMQKNEFNSPPMDPRRYGPRFFTEAPAFMRFMASRGVYVYWSFGPDNKLIYTGADQAQVAPTFNQFMDAIDPEPNGLVQYTNEQDAHDFNSVDGNSFRKPARIASNFSNFDDRYGGDLPPGPLLDFGDFETTRGNVAKTIKDASTIDHPITTKTGKGVIVCEGDRYGSRGNLDLRLSCAAAGASLYTPGYFFHSMNGERCEPFDDQTRPIAEATFRVLSACD